MSQLTEIIVKYGLVPPSMLEELKRWGMPVGDVKPAVRDLQAEPTIEKLCSAIDEAIQSEGYVLLRETDLEAIPQYLNSMRPAVIHLVVEDGTGSDFESQVGHTKSGDYIFPWRGDGITDLLTNGESYLKIDGQKIFFGSARELFYGSNKAFVVCTPSTRESDATRSPQ